MAKEKDTQRVTHPTASGERKTEPHAGIIAAPLVEDPGRDIAAEQRPSDTELSPSHCFLLKPGLHASG